MRIIMIILILLVISLSYKSYIITPIKPQKQMLKSSNLEHELQLLEKLAQQGLCGFYHKALLIPKLEKVMNFVEFQ